MGNRRATPPPGAIRYPRDAWALKALERAGVLQGTELEAVRQADTEWVATAAVRYGAASEVVAATLAKAAHVKVAPLAELDPAAAHFVPENVARQYVALPLSVTNRGIRIASANPVDLDAEQALGFVAGRQVEFQYALPEEILHWLDAVYRPERPIDRLLNGLGAAATVVAAGDARAGGGSSGTDTPAAKLVEATIADAAKERASAILFEPTEQGLLVRYRVDGVPREVMRVPLATAGSVVRRLKVLAKLDIADPRHPHEGRAAATVDDRAWELRIATVPVGVAGERVTVRLVDAQAGIPSLGRQGFAADEVAALERLLTQRAGIVLVTGPAGSGTTATLYGGLELHRASGAGVVTVEEDIEYRLPDVIQIVVAEEKDSPFAIGLKAALKETAEAVLLGELRDAETAKLAWQAATAGRFILARLRTRDAVAAVAQLVAFGIEPARIPSALKGIVAQRQLRRLCTKCAVPAASDALPPAARPGAGIGRATTLMTGRGCAQCSFTGFRGQLAIAEVLPVEGAVAEAIARGAPVDQLMDAARRAGMRTLYGAGLRRVWEGATSYDELVRVVGEPAQRPGAAAAGAEAVVVSVTAHVPGMAAAPPRTTAATAPGQPGAAGPGPLVLVADDDPDLRHLVRGILTAQGFRVAEAEDGIAALDEAQRLRPDVMLLDMDMPRLDGLGVLDTLRQRLLGRSVPVIVVTVHNDPAVESRCIELGAEDYITKPIQAASLVARTRAVLRRVGTK
jgi:type II secretory ATPase GspE/PulE/Tfp pilus assembly ATPase PilB-like protein/ActR/RegA family two-component response regulator